MASKFNPDSVDLIAALEVHGEDANERIEALNAGGCCVYAAHVAERLAKLGVPVWGVVGMWGAHENGYNANEIRERIIEEGGDPLDVGAWNDNGVEFNHVLIQFVHRGRVWLHDSNGTRPVEQDDPELTEDTCGTDVMAGYLTVRELRAFADQPEWWNCWFDRDTGIPAIRAGIRRNLSVRNLRTNFPRA